MGKKVILLAALVASCIGIAATTVKYNDPIALQNARRRIVARERLDDTHIVLTYVQGVKTWKVTNEIQHITIKTTPKKYSKLKLITAAKAYGKWDDVKTFIEANDLMDEWNACQYIEEGNAAYVAATNKVVQSGVATDEQVKAFMKAAEDDTVVNAE